jgi:ankyrin repeat protein
MFGHKEAVAILRDAEGLDDIMSASARGDLEAVEELLANGHDPGISNRGGETALMWASNGGHTAIIGILLKAKNNVNASDQHGFTALMGASQGGHLEAIRALISARADINMREPVRCCTSLEYLLAQASPQRRDAQHLSLAQNSIRA